MSSSKVLFFIAAVLSAFVIEVVAPRHGLVHAQQSAIPPIQPPVTFAKDIASIVYRNCTPCHRPGEAAPFSLLNYDDVRQRARLIAEATEKHVMPPWKPESDFGEFLGDRRLTEDQIQVFQRWAEDGFQEGDPHDLPDTPRFVDGWQLGEPDLVLTLPKAYELPAGGPDSFRNLVLPSRLLSRRFVRAIEFRPGNPKIVHHARILVDDTGETARRDADDEAPGFGGMDAPGARFPDGHFIGWAAGKAAREESLPWSIEAGSDLVVQLHLKPTGRVESVQPSIGLYFAKQPAPLSPVMLRLGSKTIDIAPGETNHVVQDTYDLPIDVTLLRIYPHAHYLAREMRVWAKLPDSSIRRLLQISNWDFNWQDEYEYARPMHLPKRTTLVMQYTYDNSAENPRNPSTPPVHVRFGSGAADEMGELLVQVLPANRDDVARLRADMARKTLLTDVAGEEKRIADAPDDFETRNALGVAYVQLGKLDQALGQFNEALRRKPDHAVAHYNIAVIAMNHGRVDDARAHFTRALAARPDYVEAHTNFGVLLESTSQIDLALDHYRRAIAIKPSHAAAQNNLGRLLLQTGDTSNALTHLRKALDSAPEDPDANYNMGRALAATGDTTAALRHVRRAVTARPEAPAMLVTLAWLLVSASESNGGDLVEAVRLAERADKLTSNKHATIADVIAAAHAAAGRYDLAVRHARIALDRAASAKDDELARAIRLRLEQYQEQLSAGSARPFAVP